MVNGKYADQYKYFGDYTEVVLNWNQGSWVKISIYEGYFQHRYVWLGACRPGFLADCRPIISVDACHLKGLIRG